jgi:hypothetical protein
MLHSRPRPSGLIEPCRPTTALKPHVGEGWLHELNYDGYRLFARRTIAGVELITRNGHNWAARYPLVTKAVGALKACAAASGGGRECDHQAGEDASARCRAGRRLNRFRGCRRPEKAQGSRTSERRAGGRLTDNPHHSCASARSWPCCPRHCRLSKRRSQPQTIDRPRHGTPPGRICSG